jgi:hypothetical protein
MSGRGGERERGREGRGREGERERGREKEERREGTWEKS